MTYRELHQQLSARMNNFTDQAWLDQDVTVNCLVFDEFFVCDKLAISKGDDFLEKGHVYLVSL